MSIRQKLKIFSKKLAWIPITYFHYSYVWVCVRLAPFSRPPSVGLYARNIEIEIEYVVGEYAWQLALAETAYIA